jgi:hypothetical protein
MGAPIQPPPLPETIPAPRDTAQEDARAVEALDALAHEAKALLSRIADARGLKGLERDQVLRPIEGIAYQLAAFAHRLSLPRAESVAYTILHPRMVSRDEHGRWPDEGG